MTATTRIPHARLPTPPPVALRVPALDVARAVALVGMVVVNYRLLLTGDGGDVRAIQALEYLDGRAAALFMVLAGVGAGLLSRPAWRDSGPAAPVRRRLMGRALVLLVLGAAMVVVWQAEILHVYAVLLALAALLVAASTRTLLALAAGAALAFPAIDVVRDYRVPTGFRTFDVANLQAYVRPGAIERLLFDGHYPLAPWAAFFLAGMALARAPLTPRTGTRLLVAGAAVALAAEAASAGLTRVVTGESLLRGVDRGPVPPTLLFVAAALGTALAVIGACLLVCAAAPRSRAVRWAAAGGRCALTLYVAHLLIGIGVPRLAGAGDWSVGATLAYALAVSAVGITAAHLWLRRRRQGPLEAVLRTADGVSRGRPVREPSG